MIIDLILIWIIVVIIVDISGINTTVNQVLNILFDKEKTFDDINSVKLTLKATRESFDNKENYKDLAELNKQI